MDFATGVFNLEEFLKMNDLTAPAGKLGTVAFNVL